MSDSLLVATMQPKMQVGQETSDEEKLYRFNGVLYPVIMCPEGHLRALENMGARSDDIMLVAYPKSGFNWMVGVLRKVITEATGVKPESDRPPLIEFYGPDGLKAIEGAPSPRLVGTHMPPDDIPSAFYTKKTKMLVVFRNPKDTLVSYYHFTNKNPVLPAQSWETFFSNFMSGEVPWGSYFDHALAWEKKMDDPNVMIVTFEELKQDLSRSVRQVSSFLGFSLTEAQVGQIAEQSTFSAMKKSSDGSSAGHIGKILFRKGEVGDWRNHFTPEQSREMDAAFNKHLAGTRLGAQLNYQLHCQ